MPINLNDVFAFTKTHASKGSIKPKITVAKDSLGEGQKWAATLLAVPASLDDSSFIAAAQAGGLKAQMSVGEKSVPASFDGGDMAGTYCRAILSHDTGLLAVATIVTDAVPANRIDDARPANGEAQPSRRNGRKTADA